MAIIQLNFSNVVVRIAILFGLLVLVSVHVYEYVYEPFGKFRYPNSWYMYVLTLTAFLIGTVGGHQLI